MSTPAMYRLFKLTAVSDRENTKTFSFGQASALAEHILRIVFHITTDEVRHRTHKDSIPGVYICVPTKDLDPACK